MGAPEGPYGQEAQCLHGKASPFPPELSETLREHSLGSVGSVLLHVQEVGLAHQLVPPRHLSVALKEDPSLLGGHLLFCILGLDP